MTLMYGNDTVMLIIVPLVYNYSVCVTCYRYTTNSLSKMKCESYKKKFVFL